MHVTECVGVVDTVAVWAAVRVVLRVPVGVAVTRDVWLFVAGGVALAVVLLVAVRVGLGVGVGVTFGVCVPTGEAVPLAVAVGARVWVRDGVVVAVVLAVPPWVGVLLHVWGEVALQVVDSLGVLVTVAEAVAVPVGCAVRVTDPVPEAEAVRDASMVAEGVPLDEPVRGGAGLARVTLSDVMPVAVAVTRDASGTGPDVAVAVEVGVPVKRTRRGGSCCCAPPMRACRGWEGRERPRQWPSTVGNRLQSKLGRL